MIWVFVKILLGLAALGFAIYFIQHYILAPGKAVTASEDLLETAQIAPAIIFSTARTKIFKQSPAGISDGRA